MIAAQTAGAAAAPTPMLILHGDADMNVPLALSDQLLARLCAAGQVVERRVLPGQTHFIALTMASLDGIPWLDGLRAGTPAVNSCPA